MLLNFNPTLAWGPMDSPDRGQGWHIEVTQNTLQSSHPPISPYFPSPYHKCSERRAGWFFTCERAFISFIFIFKNDGIDFHYLLGLDESEILSPKNLLDLFFFWIQVFFFYQKFGCAGSVAAPRIFDLSCSMWDLLIVS